MAKFIAVLALVCALSLAGCSGGGGDGDSNSSTSSSSGSSTGPGGNGTGNGTGGMLEPIVLTGTVSGVQDCALEGGGQNAVSAANVAIPAEASNRSYALAFSGGSPGPAPAGFAGCIGFAGGAITGGLTGTIPDGATAAQVAVNLGNDVTYTLTIT